MVMRAQWAVTHDEYLVGLVVFMTTLSEGMNPGNFTYISIANR